MDEIKKFLKFMKERLDCIESEARESDLTQEEIAFLKGQLHAFDTMGKFILRSTKQYTNKPRIIIQ